MVYHKIIEKIKERLRPTKEEETFESVMKYISFHKIEGDYLEFGVWKGTSFIQAMKKAKKYGIKNMRFVGFDSFEGLPKPKGIDKKQRVFKEGDYKCDLQQLNKIFMKHKVFPLCFNGKIVLKKGWYKDTLNEKTKKELKINKIAIAMLDCDLYESTVEALNFIKDNIQDGGIIILDDWFIYKAKPDLGQQKAVKEWLTRNKNIKLIEYRRFGWCRISFIVDKYENYSRCEE